MSFKDKVVIVTGASAGIGAAIAVGFSADGARVVMVGRDETKLAAVAARCDNPLVVKADVGNDDDAKRIIDQTIKHFGQIDVLINNAGIITMGNLKSGNVIDSYDAVMPVNLRAVVLLTSLSTPHLIKTGGNVVNISSVAGHIPSKDAPMYAVSKAALTHFSLCAAAELAPHGVRVNTISPGPVVTNIFETINISNPWDRFKEITALNRVSEAEEIADLVKYVASDKAKAITGSNYISDNGYTISSHITK